MIRSPANFGKVLDAIAAGLTREQAIATLGGRPGIWYTWQRKSIAAEKSGDTDSIFYFPWPSDSTANYLHHLVRRATERYWGFHQSFLLRSQFAVKDGKPAYAVDDFGAVLFDDVGLPCVEQLVTPELPKQRPWKARRDGLLDPWRKRTPKGRPRLYPEGTAARDRKPAPPIPAPVFTGNALADYVAANAPKRPMTDLEKDLRDRLAAGPKNPKPTAPVHIVRDQHGDAAQERVSNPSNQEGLPTQMADRPARVTTEARPPQPNYARGAKAAALDCSGVRPGTVPRGGFKVA